MVIVLLELKRVNPIIIIVRIIMIIIIIIMIVIIMIIITDLPSFCNIFYLKTPSIFK